MKMVKKKQDCEINAAKRLIPALRKQHPQLEIIVLGDSLFSKHTMVELVRKKRMAHSNGIYFRG